MSQKAHLINTRDNVAVAVEDIYPGEKIVVDKDRKIEIKIKDKIKYGHKFSLKDMSSGEPIIKYGEEIGEATKKIEKGEHVHVHNVESRRGRGDLK